MKLKVYNRDGSQCEEREFSAFPTFDGNKGVQVLKEVIVAYQAALRQGNASAKTRAEVSGSGKKPYRQKGTGMARCGEKRSPIWYKGGVVFGPKPRDYSQDVPKRMKIMALMRAMFDRAQEGEFGLIEEITVAEPKTKAFVAILKRIHGDASTLLVDVNFNDNVVLASRNIDRLHMIDAASINAMDMVRYDRVLVSVAALERLLTRGHNI